MSTGSIYDEVVEGVAEDTINTGSDALSQLASEFTGGEVIASAIKQERAATASQLSAIQKEQQAVRANQALTEIVDAVNSDLSGYGAKITKAEAMDLHKRAVAGEFDAELSFGGLRAGTVISSLVNNEDLARALAQVAKVAKKIGDEPQSEYGMTTTASSGSRAQKPTADRIAVRAEYAKKLPTMTEQERQAELVSIFSRLQGG